MIDIFARLNISLFFLINNGFHSSFNDLWIGNATYLGIGWIAYGISLGALLTDRPHLKRNFLILLIAVVTEGIILSAVKALFASPRPLTFFANSIKDGKVIVHVMFEPLYWGSFPSGHTQTAFCAATFLAWLVKQSPRFSKSVWLPLTLYAIATLVGISRIYVGAHFPVDVLGGIVIGVIPVFIITKIVEKREA